MKKSYLTLVNSLLVVILGFFGFQSCDKSKESPDMYGTPTADYKVTGRIVSSESGEAIPGIRVVVQQYRAEGVNDEYIYKSDTLFSATSGHFEYTQGGTGWDKVRLKADDVDGVENGHFKSLERSIEFTSKPEGASGWYKGMFTEDLGNVPLIPEEE